MGRYAGAKDVTVTDRFPMLDEKEGTSIVEIISTKDGASQRDGLPYAKVEVRILESTTYPAGEIRTWLTKQKAGKGAQNYFFRDLKGFVGAAYGLSDKSACSPEQLEEFFGSNCPKAGVILEHRVYSKPPNENGKVFTGSVTNFMAESLAEYDDLMTLAK